MAIRVKLGDTTIEVDTGNELREVLSVVTDRGIGRVQQPAMPMARARHTLKSVYDRLSNSGQGVLLRALRQHPEGMTDAELRLALQLKDNSALAGVVSGISKNAEKYGFRFDQVIIKEKRKGEDRKRVYHYKLTDEMMEIVPGTLV